MPLLGRILASPPHGPPEDCPWTADRLARFGPVYAGVIEPGLDAFADHLTLEFSQSCKHRERKLAHCGGCVEALLVRNEVDAGLAALPELQPLVERQLITSPAAPDR